MAEKTVGQLVQATTIVTGDLLVVWPASGPGPLKSIDYSVLYSALNTALGVNFLAKASNLGDLASPTAARANLGLGGAAVLNVGTSAGTVAAGDDARFGQVANGSITPAKLSTGGPNWDGAGNVYGVTFSGTFFGNLNGNAATATNATNASVAGALTAGNKSISGNLNVSGTIGGGAIFPSYDGSGNFAISQNGANPTAQRIINFTAGRFIAWNQSGDTVVIGCGVSAISMQGGGRIDITAPGGLYVNGVFIA